MQFKITLLLLLCIGVGYAQNTTVWTGATDSNWTTASNWNNGIPDASKEVIIPRMTSENSTYPVISGDVMIDYPISVAGELRFENGQITSQTELTIWAGGQVVNDAELLIEGKFRIVGSMLNTGKLTANTRMDIIGSYTNAGLTTSRTIVNNRGSITYKTGSIWDNQYWRYGIGGEQIVEPCSWIVSENPYVSSSNHELAEAGGIILITANSSELTRAYGTGWVIVCPDKTASACAESVDTGCDFPYDLYDGNITYWTGAQSSDFANEANWSNGLPQFSSQAIIPATPESGRFPSINAPITLDRELVNKGTLHVRAPLTGESGFKLINENRLINESLLLLPGYDDPYSYRVEFALDNKEDAYFENRDTLKGKVLNYGQVVNKGKIVSNGGENYDSWINESEWEITADGFENKIDRSTPYLSYGIIMNRGVIRSDAHFLLASRLVNREDGIIIHRKSQLNIDWRIENDGHIYILDGGYLHIRYQDGELANNNHLEFLGKGDVIADLGITATGGSTLENSNIFQNNPNGYMRMNGYARFENANYELNNLSPNILNSGTMEIGAAGYAYFTANSYTTNQGTFTNRGEIELGINRHTASGLFYSFGMLVNASDAHMTHNNITFRNAARFVNEVCGIVVTSNEEFESNNFQNEGLVVYRSGTPSSNTQGSGTELVCTDAEVERCIQENNCEDEFAYINPNVWTGNVSEDWFDAANWSNGLPEAEQTAVVPANPTGGRFPIITERADLEYFIVNEGELTFNSITNILKNGMRNEGTIQITPDATVVQTGDSLKAIQNYGFINNEGVLLLNGWLFNYERLRSNNKLWLGGYLYSRGRSQYHVSLGYLRNYETLESTPNDSLIMYGDWDNYGDASVGGYLEIYNNDIRNNGNLTLEKTSTATANHQLWYGTPSAITNVGQLDMKGYFRVRRADQVIRNSATIRVHECAFYEGGIMLYSTGARIENAGYIKDVRHANETPMYVELETGQYLDCLGDCSDIDESIQVLTQAASITIGESGVVTLDPSVIDAGSDASGACGYNFIRLEVEPNTFTCEDAGEQSVTLIVFDAFGNFNRAEAQVTLIPSADCGATAIDLRCRTTRGMDSYNVNQNHPDGYSSGIPQPYASTECPEGITEIRQLSGPMLAEDEILPVGEYDITFEAIDACGNSATCTMLFIVEANMMPFICPDDILVRVPKDATGAVVEYPDPMANLYCGWFRTRDLVYSPNLPSGSFFPAGTTTVTLSYTDGCDFEYECSFNVTISPIEITAGTDLEMHLAVGNMMPGRFTNTTFTTTVINTGATTATNVVIDFPIPDSLAYTNSVTEFGLYKPGAEQWELGDLASGEFASLELTLYVLGDLQMQSVFTQVQSLDQADTDSTPGNGICCMPMEDDEAVITFMAPTQRGGGDLPAPDINAIVDKTEEKVTYQQQLYPSPTSGLLNLKTTIETDYVVKIWSVAGQLLHQANVPAASFEQQFDVSNCKAGIYLLSIEAADYYEVQRFVKQ